MESSVSGDEEGRVWGEGEEVKALDGGFSVGVVV